MNYFMGFVGVVVMVVAVVVILEIAKDVGRWVWRKLAGEYNYCTRCRHPLAWHTRGRWTMNGTTWSGPGWCLDDCVCFNEEAEEGNV